MEYSRLRLTFMSPKIEKLSSRFITVGEFYVISLMPLRLVESICPTVFQNVVFAFSSNTGGPTMQSLVQSIVRSTLMILPPTRESRLKVEALNRI
jgi:hypothetical protein